MALYNPGSYVLHLMFGDVYQPSPALGRDAQNRPFRQQTGESTFLRFTLGGVDTVWLWEQHRSNTDIVSLINYVLPRARMRVAPGVEDRPDSSSYRTRHIICSFLLVYTDTYIYPIRAALSSDARCLRHTLAQIYASNPNDSSCIAGVFPEQLNT